jgi:hypothetical protein
MMVAFRKYSGGWLGVVGLLLVTTCGCGGSEADAESLLTADSAAAAEESDNEVVGLSLGEFIVRDFHPTEGVRTSLEFELYGQVPQAEADSVAKKLSDRRHKVRSNVITAARVAPMSEFDDPDLVMVRRRILLRLRRILPELSFQDIVLSDFSYSVEE